jgi:tRNA pseudouridine55 synthase
MTEQEIREQFDQVILVDKPAGITSFGVVSRIRGKLSREKREVELAEFFAKNPEISKKYSAEQKENFAKNPREIPAEIREKANFTKKLKVGHAGTLDPFATGLLIVLTGKMTREQDKFMRHDKTYFAKIELGKTSTTGDPEGEISRKITDAEEEYFAKNLTQEKIAKILEENFTGEITQIPPLFSAIKMDGQKGYDVARNFAKNPEKAEQFREKFEKEKSRKVKIYSLEIVDYSWPFLDVRAEVSSGTYIRTLAEDIGEKLGTGAFCLALRREKVGGFSVKNSQKLKAFAK